MKNYCRHQGVCDVYCYKKNSSWQQLLIFYRRTTLNGLLSVNIIDKHGLVLIDSFIVLYLNDWNKYFFNLL